MDRLRKSSAKNLVNAGVLVLLFAAAVGAQSAWAKPPNDKPPVVSPPVPIQSITGERTRAVGINDRGVVVGTYGAPFDMARSFVWTARTGFRDIGEFTATAINNCGEIAAVVNLFSPGSLIDPQRPTRTVVFHNGKIVDIGKLDPSSPTAWAYATDINDKGHVSGMAGDTADSSLTPFLWTPETGMQRLDGPEFHSGAHALNNRDHIVGTKQLDPFNGLQRPALWSPGQPARILDGLGGRFGSAVAINERGQIVGNSETDFLLFPLRAGFFWSASQGTVPLQPYASQQVDTANQARDINAHGIIVGAISVEPAPGAVEPHAALWTSPSDFLIFHDTASEAVAINERGQIVGNLLSDDPRSGGAMIWKLKTRPHDNSHVAKHCRRDRR